MYPYLTLFGTEIPSYGVMVIVGGLASLLYIKIAEKRAGLTTREEADIELALICAVIGAVIGAKILYLFTAWDGLIQDIADYGLITAASYYVSGGFVFYGGLAGAILAVYIYCKAANVPFERTAKIMTPAIPLFHVFGRVGCFLEGCCYGIESETFGIAFSVSPIAPNGVKLLPVQLFEAAVELVILIALLHMQKRKASGISMLSAYLLMYAPARFILEFFRGDEYRGVFMGVSLSQAISVIAFVSGLYLLHTGRKRVRTQKMKGNEEFPNDETTEAIREVRMMKEDPSVGATYTDVEQMVEDLLTDA